VELGGAEGRDGEEFKGEGKVEVVTRGGDGMLNDGEDGRVPGIYCKEERKECGGGGSEEGERIRIWRTHSNPR
jgi:hypothetical protein